MGTDRDKRERSRSYRRSSTYDRVRRRDNRRDEKFSERPDSRLERRKRSREQISHVSAKRRRHSRSPHRERDYKVASHRGRAPDCDAYEERTVRRVPSKSRDPPSRQDRDYRVDDRDSVYRSSRRVEKRGEYGNYDSRRRRGGSSRSGAEKIDSNRSSRRESRRRDGDSESSRRRGSRPTSGAQRDVGRRDREQEMCRGEAETGRLRDCGEQSYRDRSSRHRKRSRSRSVRGNKKRSRRDSRPPVLDDEEGHLIFSKGDVIQDRYRIIRELGEGTFGKVVECEDMAKNKNIAIKIIKNVKKYRDAAKLEINVLKKLAGYDPECKYKCVQMYDWFDYHGHKCIAFQLLGKSVFDFLKDNNYEPYPMEHVRSVAYELTLAVNFVHSNHLTHTDLKPENILFFDSNKVKKNKKSNSDVLLNPEIRLIDFGSATFDHEHHSSIIQTRHYRAPEVILKIGWTQACDIWSIGCIVIELALGYMLFDTHNSLEHLAMMERILGPIPQDMALQSGSSYFVKGKGVLDWDRESKEGRYVRRKVKELERYIPRDQRENRDWIDMFDLIRKMLEYDPKKRIKLADAFSHPFLEKYNLRKPSRSSSGYESR